MEAYLSDRGLMLLAVAGGGEGLNAAAQRVFLAAETPDLIPGVSVLFLLLFLFLLGRPLYRQFCHRRLAARMRGRNHPAIPAITYPSAKLSHSSGAGKQKKPVAAATTSIPPLETFLVADPVTAATRVDAPGVDAPGVDAPRAAAPGTEVSRREVQEVPPGEVATSEVALLPGTEVAAALGDYTFYSLLDRMDID
jgi:hypothetical protein